MTDEIIYGLMNIFKYADNQPLTLKEITQRMQAQGFYENVEDTKAAVDIFLHYLNPPIFHETKNYRRRDNWRQWSVARWLHPKENNLQDSTASLLQIGKEIQRTVSPGGTEIKNGTIPLRGDFDSFFASMDIQQQMQSRIDISYYASENTTCSIEQDDNEHWFLKSSWLREWYKENRIEPGDKVWLVVKSIIPLAINIYTEWERNPDTYRRYRQLQDPNSLLSTDLPIRDIVWDFLEQTQKIAHRSDIAKTVLAKRPEVSEQSVYGCLSANPYLFVRVGEGKWGLKEWGLERVTMAKHPAGDPIEENIDENLLTTTVPLDYILANIASENLVYKILKSSKPLTVAEITERISKFLYVDKNILARTTFFNPADARFSHLQDGTFTLRENLEEVIHQLAERERETKMSLESEIHLLKAEIASMMFRHEKQVAQIKEERDILQNLAEEWIERHEQTNDLWEKRSQLLSEFFTKIIPCIGQNKLKEIFEQLRQKSEMGGTNESI